MLVLKKKEIVAAALVAMIGVAGYLNWSYQDTVRVTDSEDYIATGKKLGEAQYVSTDSENVKEEDFSSDYFAEAKQEKETARSKALEILEKTAENESFDEETKKNARQRMIEMAQSVEKEAIIENIAKAKGYNEISVYIDGASVDVVIKKQDFGENDVKVLKQIITEQLSIGADGIKIIQKTK